MVLICGDGLPLLDVIAARWRTGEGDCISASGLPALTDPDIQTPETDIFCLVLLLF